MAEEIERKFLLLNEDWRAQVRRSAAFAQGYLIGARQASVRVRIEDDEANLNIKGMTLGVSRTEFEYPIPLADARQMLGSLCEQPLIEKTRHYVDYEGDTWEIDEFQGDNAGLVVAEIELEHEDQSFARPSWLGEEVSADPRYYNVMLVKHPYREWRHE